jgi:hypothetical protein
MKRDWDLIRKQLTDIEEEKDIFADLPRQTPKWEDGETEEEYSKRYSESRSIENRILGHLELLIDSGFIEGIQIIRSLDGAMHYARSNPRLTMPGHDLLDTIRSATVWNKVKEVAKNKGLELSFDTVKLLAGTVLKQIIGT